MSAPIFGDPVFDGATDPSVIRNEATREYWMFYTQRRTSAVEPGVAWVHGSRIGIAVSADAGATWRYRGVVDGLDPADAPGPNTHWAPEVIRDGDRYRMYLTWIAGIPTEWDGHRRSIVEFESTDLENWTRIRAIPLSSNRVIDAAIARTGDGRFRLWYKDEADDSTTWAAVGDDLSDWRVEGQAIGGAPHEGPNVFELGGWFWMLTDEWRGQRVHRSADGLSWQRQGLILDAAGRHPLDHQVGRHADVVNRGNDAVVFYFTHPHWDGSEIADATGHDARISVVSVARVWVDADELRCDRNPELPLLLP
ncbi:hypothetical protein L1277_002099 [Okibacterium sp. HSC-33S16]|uniref:family 43 glycosylhydrolase n=1 Tax=Okibacterium sp. HSC-33S16 TaxID=2910965 RepID=UPI00209D76B4|nr:family 43 glycosylhydrolase [Okibacterium sp. HSC-33S16]MCP2032000.1 hypothetical protein [Okibacterium sp. HSC-33S16]